MTRWTMVADIERCVGCQTCTAACRHANATSPAVEWRKVLDVEAGAYPNVSRTFVPVGCQHCDDAPCTHVCPSRATYRRDDGIVVMDYDLCIGCAYCDVACPYQARFKIEAPRFAYGKSPMQNEIEREEPSRLGVAQKCTFCSDRVDFGLANDLVPGIDPLATPACVNACIADALHFGDADDPSSNVSRLLREQKHFRMHEELGTDPAFYYVYDRADPPNMPTPAPPAVAVPAVAPGQIRTRGVEPVHQKHWDWKAAGNFMCGGAGAGLFAFASLAAPGGVAPVASAFAACALVALGLFLVLLKIGRPWRSLNVFRQPRRSWMAREAWIALAFFPLAAFALWSQARLAMLAVAILGLAFLLCQAMILNAAKGIPAWREPMIVPLIIATGLTEGGGLFLAALAVTSTAAPPSVAIAVCLLVAVRAWTWRAFVRALETKGAPVRTLAVLDGSRTWFAVLGLALPLALIVGGLLIPAGAAILLALGGVSAFAAGAALKLMLVTRAAFNQGFALPHVPRRGVGGADRAIKPGWSLP
jgi:phenylacetyl-CoA:acceptor oxidoreductase subunit 1